MDEGNHSLYISADSLRKGITSRLIPLLFVSLWVSMVFSFMRIPKFT